MSCGNPHEVECSEVLERVYEYLDGEMDAERVHVIREHLDECGPCLRAFGLEDSVKALVKRCCGSDDVPSDLRGKVMSRIEAVRGELREA